MRARLSCFILSTMSVLKRTRRRERPALNVIISGHSDARVLNLNSSGAFFTYMEALGFANSCLGQAETNPQAANLGDGQGVINQSEVLRYALPPSLSSFFPPFRRKRINE